MKSSLRFAAAVGEQGLVGAASFAVSWTALRYLATADVALYAFWWAVAWAAFACFSEWILTPLRRQLLRSDQATILRPAGMIFTAAAAFALMLAVALEMLVARGPTTWAALSCSVAFAAVGLFGLRAYFQERKRPLLGLLISAVYAACTFCAALVSSLAGFGVTGLLAAPAIGAMLGTALGLACVSADGGMEWKPVLVRLKRVARDGVGFGAATLLRTATYSVGFMMLAISLAGEHAVAVYVACLAVISPAQMASSTVPWILLPRLVRRASNFAEFGREFALQALAYGGLATALCATLAVIWTPWIEFTVGNSGIRDGVDQKMIAVCFLLAAATFSSLASTAMHALHKPTFHLVSVVSGGFAGLASLLLGVPPLEAATVPYGVATLISVAAVLTILRKGEG